MSIGQMKRRVTVQAITRTADSYGGQTETATSVATLWAYVEPLQGDEQLRAMQTGIQRPHRFTVRYRDDISAAEELIYNGRTFDVKSVVDTDERHRELVILADEVLAGVS
jgi:SPP1 family predicted phage head-tail adaptor